MRELRLVLGDQLNHSHSWWKEDPGSFDVVLIEARSETDYVMHHVQKVVAFFLAMRSFADWLKERGYKVQYVALDDVGNKGSIAKNLEHLIQKDSYRSFVYQLPDEYRLDKELRELKLPNEVETKCVDTEHFLTARNDLSDFFKGKKTYLMESFYRMMRTKHGILMRGEEPVGGTWNYDKENRKSLPDGLDLPDPKVFNKDATHIVKMLEKQKVKTFGSIDAQNFPWPTKRSEALRAVNFFIDYCLQNFGNYQDAMKSGAWSMFHSRISFCLNSKLISPMEVVEKVEEAYRSDKKKAPLAAVEGYIRQIIGWREYMRGVYWAQMPEFEKMNFLSHQRKMPKWFWTGETKMNCLKDAVKQSLDYAYAHHIQRLMITGNFALLAGIHPDEVDEWYLGIYIDAIQWAEITNTRGMSQFADGGIVGTKPYVSSANYIDKMSDYCKGCYYDKKKKTGEKACPFNSLYWDFYDRHRDKLENNPRIGFVYRTLDKMAQKKKEELIKHADSILKNLDAL